MRVLGIDPGSETLGWGIVEGSGLKYAVVEFGVVKSNPREAFAKRPREYLRRRVAVIESFQPDVVSIEEAFYAVNAGVAIKLGQVRGVMLLLAEQRGLEIAEYAPRLIKQTVGRLRSRGKASGAGNGETSFAIEKRSRLRMTRPTRSQSRSATSITTA
jgi:crossover junction endodeoxyribonuclease RuvC